MTVAFANPYYVKGLVRPDVVLPAVGPDRQNKVFLTSFQPMEDGNWEVSAEFHERRFFRTVKSQVTFHGRDHDWEMTTTESRTLRCEAERIHEALNKCIWVLKGQIAS